MHREQRIADVDGAQTHAPCGNRSNRAAASQIRAHDVVLRGDAGCAAEHLKACAGLRIGRVALGDIRLDGRTMAEQRAMLTTCAPFRKEGEPQRGDDG